MKRLLGIILSVMILLGSVSVAFSFIAAAADEPDVLAPGCYDEILDTVSYLNGNTSNMQQIIAADSVFSEYATKNGNIQAKIADGTVGNWVYNNGIANGAFTYWGRTYKKVYSEYGAYTAVENGGAASLTYRVKAGTRIEMPICMPTQLLFMLENFVFEFSADGGTTWEKLEHFVTATDTYQMYYQFTRTLCAVRINADGLFRIKFPTQDQMNSNAVKSFNSGAMNNGTFYLIPPAAFSSKLELEVDKYDEIKSDTVLSNGNIDNSKTLYADVSDNITAGEFEKIDTSALFGREHKYLYTVGDSETAANTIQYAVCAGTLINIPVGMLNSHNTLFENIKFEFSRDGKTYTAVNAKNMSFKTVSDVEFSQGNIGSVRNYSVRIFEKGYLRITLPDTAAIKALGGNVSDAVFMAPAYANPSKYVLSAGEYDIITAESVNNESLIIPETTKYATLTGKVYANKLSDNLLDSLIDNTHTYVYTPYQSDTENSAVSVEYSVEDSALIRVSFGMMNDFVALFDDISFEYSADGEEYTKISSKSISYNQSDNVTFSAKQSYATGVVREYTVNLDSAGWLRITFPETADINAVSERISGSNLLTREGAVFMVPAAAVYAKSALRAGERDTLTDAVLDTSVGADRIVDGDLTTYAEVSGSIWSATVNNWTLKSLKDKDFYGSTYPYVYTPNCYDNPTPPAVTYRVKADTRLTFAIGMISAMSELWDDFTVMYSSDNLTFSSVNSDDITYSTESNVEFSTYGYTAGDIRTYSVEIAKDGFIRITFPDAAKIAETAKQVNSVIYARTGSVFLTPAAAFESNKNKSYLSAKAGQSIVSVGDGLVSVSSLIDIASLQDCLLMHNMYAKFYDGKKEITDYSTAVKSGFKIKCYADGGTQYEKDYMFDEYTVSLTLSNDVLITTKIKLSAGTFDEVNADSAALGNRYVIGSDAFSAYGVYNGSVIARPIEGSWAFREPNASDMFTLFGKEYTHVYFANRDNTDRYLMYSVAAGTKVRIPVGTATVASALFDEFAFEVSNDGGKTWVRADTTYTKYNNYVVGTMGLTYTVRIYSIEFTQDALLKITFPDADTARQVLKDTTGNDGIDYQGGYYMIPPSGWSITEPEDYSAYQKKIMTIGTYDTTSDANFRMNTTDEDGNPKNNGDCCIDNATTEYVWVQGNVKACSTSGWTFAKQYTFNAFDRYYDYVYTQFRSQRGGRGAIVYRVQRGSEVQMPIGCPTEYEHIYDAFEFLYSTDGDNWQPIASSQISYDSYVISEMSTSKYQETIRTYALQIVQDGYIKVVFPDTDFMFESLVNINHSKNFCDAGSVFVCPAAVFESSKGVKIELNSNEMFTELGTDSITVYQEASAPITVAQLISKFKCYNSYLKFFNSDGSEINGENTVINSSMQVKLISRGSIFDADNTVKNVYTLKVNTVDKLILPTVKANNSKVYIDDVLGCIEVEYSSDSPVSIERLISMLEYKYLSYKLVDSDGNPYTSTASTVGQDSVYIRFYTDGCPYARDGVLLYEYELIGISATEEMTISSLDLQKAVIDYDMKIIYFEDGLTVSELLSILRITGATAGVYSAPAADFSTTRITDNGTVLESGMTLELQIGATVLYYELIPYSAITSQKTLSKTTQYTVTTPGAPSDRPLIIAICCGILAAILAGAATVIILIIVKKKRKKQTEN